MLYQLALLAPLFAIRVAAVGTAFGYATGTTGGGSAAAATPTSNAQLVSWLGDSTARVIVLTTMFDFTGTSVSGTGCKPWTCSPNPQLAIDKDSWCENYEPSAATTSITYDAAGLSPIYVGSNKTLLGKGSNAGIKGTGLYLQGVQNVIIQNIRITTLNPEYVWGGDAIAIDGGSYIWIDHIGRQFIATGYGAVTHTTFSNNVFNGQSTYSATCNACQYWVAILTGNGDQITLALNYFYYTSGRGPHVGGTSGYTQKIHIYNNYYVTVLGHAIDPEVGAYVLAEGNYFNAVTTPVLAGVGAAYVPTTSAQASACSSYIGRVCQVNAFSSSGTVSAASTSALTALADSTVKGASVMAASAVGAYVQANAGLGIVN
ncbi:hypothetical protein FRB94_010440 [Tulasnella sp. JGI-2019a]|nr:hypothetical protein FRB94_010440 [Tulasnella sp. JGI-2019a]